MSTESRLDELYKEGELIGEEMLKITDRTLEDDAQGNPIVITDEESAKLRDLTREMRNVQKEIKKLES